MGKKAGQSVMVQLLIKPDTKPNALGADLKTPLMLAAEIKQGWFQY